MKKLLFITHESSRTGAPIMLLHLIKWLLKYQPEAVVDVLTLKGGNLENNFKKLCSNYYDYSKLTKSKKLTVLQRVLSKFGLNKKPDLREILINELIENNYKVVYANTIVTVPIANYLVSKDDSINLIAHIHELNFMIKLVLPDFNSHKNSINQFIVPSHIVKTNLITNWSIPKNKINVVYECSEVNFSGYKPKMNKKDHIFTVGASGTVDLRKGFDVFFQVARYINSNFPDVLIKFVWVGKLQLVESLILEEDILKLGLKDKIIFTGETENPWTNYNDFDVFLMTSREDPFPLVCIEVGMMGKPIISFDQAVGTNEVLKMNDGFIVPYLNIEVMAQKVVEYYNNPNLIKEHGVKNQKAFSQFTPEIICPKLYAIIQKHINI